MVTLGVFRVGVKGRCLIEVSQMLFAVGVTPLEILEVHVDCAGSQNLPGHSGRSSRAFSDVAVTFRGRRRGNLALS